MPQSSNDIDDFVAWCFVSNSDEISFIYRKICLSFCCYWCCVETWMPKHVWMACAFLSFFFLFLPFFPKWISLFFYFVFFFIENRCIRFWIIVKYCKYFVCGAPNVEFRMHYGFLFDRFEQEQFWRLIENTCKTHVNEQINEKRLMKNYKSMPSNFINVHRILCTLAPFITQCYRQIHILPLFV